MIKVQYNTIIPENSIIKDIDFSVVDYQDAISVQIKSNPNYTIDYLTSKLLNTRPGWVLSLLKLRDFLVKPFGLKTGESIGYKEPNEKRSYQRGEQIGFFKFLKRNDNEIVMYENDKHLNLRTSVMIEEIEKGKLLNFYSITIVKYNNLFGKLYFVPVRPMHKLLIKSILKIFVKNLKKQQNEDN